MEHVKGHQDSQSTDLSLPAQLNVEADRLATEYFDQKIKPPLEAGDYEFLKELETGSTIHSCGAQLVNAHDIKYPRAITSSTRRLLREAALSPDLREYMIQKYHGWTQGTPEKVKWTAYNKAQTRMPWSKYIQIVKLANEWADTGSRHKKFNTAASDQCIYCHQQETAQHVLRCTKARQLQIQYLRRLHEMLEQANIHAGIQATLQAALRAFFGLPKEPMEWKHPDTRDALADQAEIGWDRFLFGHTANEWMHLQEQWAKTQEPPKHPIKAEQWVVKVLHLGWWYVQEAWKIRNELIHGKDNVALDQQRTRLRALVEQAYQESHILPETSQRFFSLSVEERTAQDPQETQEWLRYVNRLLTTAKKQGNWRERMGLQDIRKFFTGRGNTREEIT